MCMRASCLCVREYACMCDDASMRLCVRDIRMATFTHACLIRVYAHIRACIRVAHHMPASCLCVCVIYACMYVWREIELEEGGTERERARVREGKRERERERERERKKEKERSVRANTRRSKRRK